MFRFIYITLNRELIYVSQTTIGRGTESRPAEGLQPKLPRIQEVGGIEGFLDPSQKIQSRPELRREKMGQLEADAVDVFHRAAEGLGSANRFVDRRRNGRPRGGPVPAGGMHDLHGDELRLRPHAESDRMRTMPTNDRERRPPEGQDFRSRQGHVHVVEHRLLQRDIGTGHARRNLIVIVDDVMTSLPIFPGLAVRKDGGARGPQATPRGIPRRGDDIGIGREPQVQRRWAAAAPPRQGGAFERLLEVHHAGPQAVIVQGRETFEARGEVSETPRADCLCLANGKHAARRPPMRPVPPPQGTILTPASDAQRTTATTSSVVRGKTTAAGSSPWSAKGEPRCSRNASVRYRGAIDGPVRTRLDPRRPASCDRSTSTTTATPGSYSKRTTGHARRR